MADAAELPPLDGGLLEKPIQGSPPRQDDTEDEDPRLDTVDAYVTKAEYDMAARTAEALLRDGIRDVRIIGPYLMGSFVNQGLKGMPRIFRSVITTLKESLGAFGPEEKKTLLANTSVRWLFKGVNRQMLHHEKLKDAEWKRWREPSNRAPVEEALSLGASALAACTEALPGGDCEQALRPVLAWLQEQLSALPVTGTSVPVKKEEAPAAAAPESEEPLEDEEAEEPETDSEPRPSPRAHASSPGLPISPAMELLLRKLHAFDVLVEQEDFLKAGIVAADVLGVIERFDPRVYLPMLFTRFFAGLSTHAETLEPLLHNTESLAFRSLDQLYRVDLDSFLEQHTREEE
ncbi:type VI secretion system protein IglI family protein [Hyalangium minutum]|uniref:Uncharacterized protein n=1 Tax=Hyalangium minutum TaxID=394096 RepID=A0A085WCI4_9BACT|nr:type VI secretion system protein IglI family protein [Hyalangium minutum]KFE65397.1 hypothetical protein DB31_1513 [Hyalangium minutum]